jgi:ribosome-binding protein aMBF1 (putative translation factor)
MIGTSMGGRCRLVKAKEILAEQLANDPELRAAWERTALARAVALAVLGYRIRHGLSQTQLAKQLDMRQPHVSRLELGEHNPSPEILQRLAGKLGLRVVLEIAPSADKVPPVQAGPVEHSEVVTVDGVRIAVSVSAA